MSEARKKLKKEDKYLPQSDLYLDAQRHFTNIEEVRRKEQEVKEAIKRKKEELRLKREERLVKFKHDIRCMIDDEKAGIEDYVKLMMLAHGLSLAENERDLARIYDEEKRHLALLESMMGTWITPMRKEKQPTHTLSGRPISRRILET